MSYNRAEPFCWSCPQACIFKKDGTFEGYCHDSVCKKTFYELSTKFPEIAPRCCLCHVKSVNVTDTGSFTFNCKECWDTYKKQT